MSERLRPLGLIGGMSWHSTATYYRHLNERVAAARGAHASARISLQSLDFSEVRACQVADDYARSGRMLAEAGRACEAGGAEGLAICTNLMHRNFDDLVAAGSMAKAKEAGKVRMEGKDYVMADGDVVEFRFNV